MRVIALFLVTLVSVTMVWGADEVLSVPNGESIVVTISRLPVRVHLADIEIPQRDEIPQQAQARVEELIMGANVQVIHKPEFGTDDSGTGRVHIKKGSQHINAILVAEGLALYKAGDGPTPYGRMLDLAQSSAKKDGVGVWGLPPEAAASTVVAAAAAAAPSSAEPKTAKAVTTGPFVSELNGRLYFPSDDARAASINARRRIYYASEKAAKKAGKTRGPDQVSVADAGLEEAEQLMAEGEKVYADAIAAGNTSNRDVLYGEAFVKLTQAMQVWSKLVEENPDDAEIGEKLRRTMQLRYGAMKQRRF